MFTRYMPTDDISVLIRHAQMPLLKAQTRLSSKTRDSNFGLSLYLHRYFVYASSKDSGESSLCADSHEHVLQADVISTEILCTTVKPALSNHS